ncbi:MAG: hypothetical protein IJ268_05275 [Proteobacteria bacterium]|nr:hypothetical protein [Pseudomonadota bacterium]
MAINTIFHDVERILFYTKQARIALTGGLHVGKTTTARKLFDCLDTQGFDVVGVVENAVFVAQARIGYNFEALGDLGEFGVEHSDRVWPVARREGADGRYVFMPDAWVRAERWMRASECHEVLVIDELGRLEAGGGGLMPALRASLGRAPRHVIAAVRRDAVKEIECQIGKFDRIFELGAE